MKLKQIKWKILVVITILVVVFSVFSCTAANPTTSNEVSAASLFNEDVVTSIYQSAGDAVVEINITQESTGFFGQSTVEEGIGSGFLVDSDGYIVTNNHVVDDASTVEVKLSTGEVLDAEVMGKDAIHDLAVIKVDSSSVAGITPLKLADSNEVIPGQMALAIGNPYGLQNTITVGIISGLNRNIDDLYNMIQTDAALNPGNSGGPLLNSDGEVVGVNTAIETSSTGYSGLGFAVPSNTVTKVLDDLKTGQQIQRPWIGISGITITRSNADQIGVDVNSGVYVISVVQDSPAEAAGMVGSQSDSSEDIGTGGDVITAVDGKTVTEFADLASYVIGKNVGDTVQLSVIRDGENITVDITLAAMPETTEEDTQEDNSMPWQLPDNNFPDSQQSPLY